MVSMDLKQNHFCFGVGLKLVSCFVLDMGQGIHQFDLVQDGVEMDDLGRMIFDLVCLMEIELGYLDWVWVYPMETIWDFGPNDLCLEYPGNNILDIGFKVSK